MLKVCITGTTRVVPVFVCRVWYIIMRRKSAVREDSNQPLAKDKGVLREIDLKEAGC